MHDASPDSERETAAHRHSWLWAVVVVASTLTALFLKQVAIRSQTSDTVL
jgi:hypothetical protein